MDDMRYSARIVWSDEDGGYIATAPELEGVSAFGETLKEALTELGIARDAWLEEWCASGRDLPVPLTLPSYSGQFRLRLPRSSHGWLAAQADLEGVSLNTLVVQTVRGACMDPQVRFLRQGCHG